MIEYKMVEGNDPGSLERKVDKYLNDGWHLAGNSFLLDSPDCFMLFQPMAKNPPPVKVITRYFMIEAVGLDAFNKLLHGYLSDGYEIYGIPLAVVDEYGDITYSIMLEKPFNFDDQLEFCVRQPKDIDQSANSDNIPE